MKSIRIDRSGMCPENRHPAPCMVGSRCSLPSGSSALRRIRTAACAAQRDFCGWRVVSRQLNRRLLDRLYLLDIHTLEIKISKNACAAP